MEYGENTIVSVTRFFTSMGLALVFKIIKPEMADLSVVGMGLFFYYGQSFYYKLGRTIPIRELIIIIALLQWVVAPVLSYHFFKASEFYFMSIDENRYMNFVVPATAALILGLLIPLRRNQQEEEHYEQEENPDYFFKRGRILLILGFTAFILSPFAPRSLNYFFLLLSHTSIIGSFYLLKSNSKFKYPMLLLAFAPVLIGAANSAIFHEVFIWGGFLLIMFTYLNKSSIIAKPILLASLSVSIFIINAVKRELRETVWADDDAQTGQIQGPGEMQGPMGPAERQNHGETGTSQSSKTSKNAGKLFGLMGNQISSSDKKSDQGDDKNQGFIDRLNQGWIIARIMYVVPQYQQFGEGETILDGIKAALLPRILAPDKAVSGGTKYFEKYTGMPLNGASMNLGIVGEAYANFGEFKGMLFMLIYGLFFNLMYMQLVNRSRKNEEYLVWLPFVFFYVIKAEEDFTSIFNQFVKSILVMAMLFYLMKRMVKEEPFIEIQNEEN